MNLVLINTDIRIVIYFLRLTLCNSVCISQMFALHTNLLFGIQALLFEIELKISLHSSEFIAGKEPHTVTFCMASDNR